MSQTAAISLNLSLLPTLPPCSALRCSTAWVTGFVSTPSLSAWDQKSPSSWSMGFFFLPAGPWGGFILPSGPWGVFILPAGPWGVFILPCQWVCPPSLPRPPIGAGGWIWCGLWGWRWAECGLACRQRHITSSDLGLPQREKRGMRSEAACRPSAPRGRCPEPLATQRAKGRLRVSLPLKSCPGRARGVPYVCRLKEEQDQPPEWASRLFIALPLSASLLNFLERPCAGEGACINLLTIAPVPIYNPEDAAVRSN